MYRANSEAAARGAAPPQNPDPDAGIVANTRVDKTDLTIDPYVEGSSPTTYHPFRAYGPPRPAGTQIAFTVRAWDQWAAYEMNGLHGVIGYAIPADQVGTFGDGYGAPVTPFRAVYRPVPQNWDAYYRTGGLAGPPAGTSDLPGLMGAAGAPGPVYGWEPAVGTPVGPGGY